MVKLGTWKKEGEHGLKQIERMASGPVFDLFEGCRSKAFYDREFSLSLWHPMALMHLSHAYRRPNKKQT